MHLKATPTVTGLVDPASIHPLTTPPLPRWPFVRLDAPQSIPISLTCVEGATVTFLLHGFAGPKLEGGIVVETGEEHASRLGSALKTALHNRRVPIEATSARLRVRSARLQRDGDEEGAYHAVLSVEARVLAA